MSYFFKNMMYQTLGNIKFLHSCKFLLSLVVSWLHLILKVDKLFITAFLWLFQIRLGRKPVMN